MSRFILIIIISTYSNNIYSAEGKGGMPQLNPESFSSQLFWLLIFFLILYIAISSFFIPKIKSIRENRDKIIEDLISESKNINDSIEQIVNKISFDKNKQREISDNEIKNAINENKAVLEEKISLLDKEIEKKREDISLKLDNSKVNIEKKIPEIVVSLSDQIFEKILDEKNNSKLSDFKKFSEDQK